MPRGKNSKTASAASKTVAEPIKEAAAAEKASVKSTAGRKKSATAKAAATKSAAKTTAAKKTAATVKAAKTDAKKAAATAPKTEKKAAAKPKTSAASGAVKTTAAPKKSTVRKTAKAKSDEVVFQSGDKDYTLAEITQLCKDAYRGGTRKQIKSIKVYVKAEKSKLKAYYVVNDSVNGSVDL